MKRIIVVFVFSFSSFLFSQEKLPDGWDEILLNGEKGYMNLYTGEVTNILPTAPAKKPVIAKEIDPTIYHEVKQGETLFIIAKQHNITIEKIYSLNVELNPNKIKVGQKIVVGYDKSKEGKIIYIEDENLYTDPSNNSVHYVKKGETLYSIARKHGLSVDKLKSYNNLQSNQIEIGQKLNLSE